MDASGVRILLVEDDPDDVWIMQSLLSDRWEGPYALIHAPTLSAALESLKAARPDIILVDLSLPDSHGLETFLVVYAQAGDVPMVVLTGLNDEGTAIRAVQAGAQDYLVKGQVSDEMLVRAIRYALERSRRGQAAELTETDTQEERAANEIKRRLAPTAPPQLAGYDIAAAVFPARSAAGDYFDFLPMGDGAVGIALGDVSGHGMGAALVMAETRACLRALAKTRCGVAEILTLANQLLAADSESFHFVAMGLARLEPRGRKLHYAGAGQRGYLLGTAGDIAVLDCAGPPLGVDRTLTIDETPAIELQEGEILLYFSNGAVEAESADQGRFGVERVLDAVHAHRHLPAADVVAALYDSVRRFSGRMPQLDDITAVVVKVLPVA